MLYGQMRLFLRRDWIHGAVTLHGNMVPHWNQEWDIFYWHLGGHYSGFKGARPPLTEGGADELRNVYIDQVLKGARATIF